MGNTESNIVVIPDIDIGKCNVIMRTDCDLGHLGTRGLISSIVGAVVTPIIDAMTPYVIDPILSLIVPVAEKFIKWVVSGLMTLFPELNPSTELFDIINDLKGLAAMVSTTITDFISIITLAVSDGTKTMVDGFKDGFGEVKTLIEDCGTCITQTYMTLNLTLSNIASVLGDVSSAISKDGGYVATITMFMKDIRTAVEMTVTHMINGVARAINSIMHELTGGITAIIDEVRNEIEKIYLGFKARAEQIIYVLRKYMMDVNGYAETFTRKIEKEIDRASAEMINVLDEVKHIAEKSTIDARNGAMAITGQISTTTQSFEKKMKKVSINAEETINTLGAIMMVGIVLSTFITMLYAYIRLHPRKPSWESQN
jgi:hypothetical protein